MAQTGSFWHQMEQIWDFKIRTEYILAQLKLQKKNLVLKKSHICPIWCQFEPL